MYASLLELADLYCPSEQRVYIITISDIHDTLSLASVCIFN